MRVRHVAVSLTAAAVMSVYGSAFAQSSQSSGAGSSTSPSGGISNTDVNALIINIALIQLKTGDSRHRMCECDAELLFLLALVH